MHHSTPPRARPCAAGALAATAEISLWGMCGGKGNGCTAYTCVDAAFPNTACASGSACTRQSEWCVISAQS